VAFKDVINDLIGNTPPSGKLPTPDQISLAWHYWREAHPKLAMAEQPKTDCAECDGEGCFTVWYQDTCVPYELLDVYPDEKSWYKKFVPCSRCQNWKRVFPTKGENRPRVFYTRQVILEKGWRFTDPYMERFLENKKKRKQVEKTRDLSHLADQALQNMPA